MNMPAGGPPTVPPPEPIAASSITFDLAADPAALERAAEAVRAMGGQAITAQATVDGAAGQVEAGNAWEGDSADSFQTHRRRLTGDLGQVGDAATRAADILIGVAAVLRSGQAMLDDERDKLAAVPVTESRARSPEPGEPPIVTLTFEPADPAQAARVTAVLTAAAEIRRDVDEQLAAQAGRLRTLLTGWSQYDPSHSSPPSLRTISDQWKPRNVRVLTYNVGQGYGNEPFYWPFDKPADAGTDEGDIPDAGRVIAGSGANVVALQEMFRGDAQALVAWLNANTDGEWEMHFAPASSKVQFDDSRIPLVDHDNWYREFGNVVLVRKGGDVGDPTPGASVPIQPEGTPLIDPEGRVLQHTDVPLQP